MSQAELRKLMGGVEKVCLTPIWRTSLRPVPKLQANDPKVKAEDYESCGLLQAIEVARMVKAGKWDRAAVEKREKRLIKWAAKEWAD